MLIRNIAAWAALSLAAGAVAEPRPYKPSNMKMSTRDLFAIARRAEAPGYRPETAQCNDGSTCAEACGAGYETCASTDNAIHCFNPTVGEVCCPNQKGDSCEAGYYCTEDVHGETWCCPEGMDLETCAKEYEVDGGLKSQTPPPATTTTSSSSTSTQAPETTTTKSSSSSAVPTAKNSTATATADITSTFKPSVTFAPPSSNGTTVVVPTTPNVPSEPSATSTEIPEGAASLVGPASGFAIFAAAVVAALL